MMKTKNICLWLGVTAALLVGLPAANAYEVNTHRSITSKALDASVLSIDSALLKRTGSQVKSLDEVLPGDARSIRDWVEDGSAFEDGINIIDTLFSVPNHFFDPQNNGKALNGFYGWITPGNPSPTWALEDTGELSDPKEQHYSFADASRYYYDALTSPEKEDREKNYGILYRALGHVIHHLQDMAHPQHVRNDWHIAGIETSLSHAYADCKFGKGEDCENGFSVGLGVSPVPVPTTYGRVDWEALGSARAFWDDPLCDNNHSATCVGTGIAEFTSRNFLSDDKNWTRQYLIGDVKTNLEYPMPKHDIGNIEFGKDIAELIPGTQLTGTLDFYGSIVIDDLRGTIKPIYRASTRSIFSDDLQAIEYEEYLNGAFTLNRFNFDAQLDFLMPRAVSYSAGLIDYFFRGHLKIETIKSPGPVEQPITQLDVAFSNATSVANPSAEPLYVNYISNNVAKTGELILAYSFVDPDGSGEKVFGRGGLMATGSPGNGTVGPLYMSGNDLLANSANLSAEYRFDLGVAIPPDAEEVEIRLIYRGKLGEHDGAVAVGLTEGLPVSGGFIISPYPLPTDGIAGDRLLHKTAGNWQLSQDEQDLNLVGGNIDWKGDYVNGVPTKVLTWNGPRARYFADTYDRTFTPGFSFSPGFGPSIYQDGVEFSVAPYPVLGAAIQKDTDGNEWIVAVCNTDTGEAIFRRPNTQSSSPAMYDALLVPDGWQRLFDIPAQAGAITPDIPWFFNGEGTEAQTMRFTFVQGVIADHGFPSDGHVRERYLVSTPASGVFFFQNLGAQFGVGLESSILAVDYKDMTEVFLETNTLQWLTVDGEPLLTQAELGPISCFAPGCVTGAVPFTQTTMLLDGIYNIADDTASNFKAFYIYYIDLRTSSVGYVIGIDSPPVHSGNLSLIYRIKHHGKQVSETFDTQYAGNSREVIWQESGSNQGTTGFWSKGVVPVGGSWRPWPKTMRWGGYGVDRQGNLLVSEDHENNPFDYLTGGDLSPLIPLDSGNWRSVYPVSVK